MSVFVIGYYALLIGASCLAAYYAKRSAFLPQSSGMGAKDDVVVAYFIGHAAIAKAGAAFGIAVELHFFAAEAFGMDELGMGDVEQVVVDQPVIDLDRFHVAVPTDPCRIAAYPEAVRN